MVSRKLVSVTSLMRSATREDLLRRFTPLSCRVCCHGDFGPAPTDQTTELAAAEEMEREDYAIALCMAHHPRLGRTSLLNCVDENVVSIIISNISFRLMAVKGKIKKVLLQQVYYSGSCPTVLDRCVETEVRLF